MGTLDGNYQEHIRMIIPESLFLFRSLLSEGMAILEGSRKTPLGTGMARGLSRHNIWRVKPQKVDTKAYNDLISLYTRQPDQLI